MDDLEKCAANYAALTPLTFIKRAAAIYPERDSVIYGNRRFSWAETFERCCRVASALEASSICPGDTVAVLAPNVPALYELHFAVPMAGAVLNAMNYRLDARTIAVLLEHSSTKLIFVDTEFLPVVHEALGGNSSRKSRNAGQAPLVVHIADETYERYEEVRAGEFGTYRDYEQLVAQGDPGFKIHWPSDEWVAISINYTSGTTSAPKGVVYHHRGAYINTLATVIEWWIQKNAVYLWTLPMFHCNGWCLPWAVAAQAGTNICLRKVIPDIIFDAISVHGVTHMSGSPTVLSMIANAQEHEKQQLPHKVQFLVGGAPPAAALLANMEAMGFSVGHGYGLTETFGPATFSVWKDEYNSLSLAERTRLKALQGKGHVAISDYQVMDPSTMTPVPRNGEVIGEVMLRGHTIMKGYLKNKEATDEAFKGGWFHTGDLGVMHTDGSIQVKDRSKDIIISGGENISSIEVESILFKHPSILDVAVVARPDEFWGETPCAFITLKDPLSVGKDRMHGPDPMSEATISAWCRQHMPRYMIPRTFVFGPLPKTATGKVQKNILRERALKLMTLPVVHGSKLESKL